MSGVYISMDMPKCCDTCFWCGVFYGEQGDNYYYCGALWQKFKSKKYCIKHPRKGRLGNCPLLPVPDHGRLGDLDALASRFDNGKQIISSCPFPEEFKAIYSQLADEMKDEIRKCPTVIPASYANDINVPDKEDQT